jgi:hypothetical protein
MKCTNPYISEFYNLYSEFIDLLKYFGFGLTGICQLGNLLRDQISSNSSASSNFLVKIEFLPRRFLREHLILLRFGLSLRFPIDKFRFKIFIKDFTS